jgi:cell division protein FtsB
MRRDTRKTWILRGVGAALLALTFGYVPYRLYGRSGFSHYLELRRELSEIQKTNVRLQLDNGRLAREAEALRTDPRLLEREARTRLQWVKPGEVLFDLTRNPERVAPSATSGRPSAARPTPSVPDLPRRNSGGEAAYVPTRLEAGQ